MTLDNVVLSKAEDQLVKFDRLVESARSELQNQLNQYRKDPSSANAVILRKSISSFDGILACLNAAMGDRVTEDQRWHLIDFWNARMSGQDSYHDHKEGMAHAGIIVSLALVGGVISANPWPPKAVASLFGMTECWTRFVAFVAVMILWYLIHFFIRWQLVNQRIAGIRVPVIGNVLRTWTTEPLLKAALEPSPCPTPAENSRWSDICYRFNSSLIPLKCANVIPDEMKGYPLAFRLAFQKDFSPGQAPLGIGERLVSYASLFLGFLLAISVWPKSSSTLLSILIIILIILLGAWIVPKPR